MKLKRAMRQPLHVDGIRTAAVRLRWSFGTFNAQAASANTVTHNFGGMVYISVCGSLVLMRPLTAAMSIDTADPRNHRAARQAELGVPLPNRRIFPDAAA